MCGIPIVAAIRRWIGGKRAGGGGSSSESGRPTRDWKVDTLFPTFLAYFPLFFSHGVLAFRSHDVCQPGLDRYRDALLPCRRVLIVFFLPPHEPFTSVGPGLEAELERLTNTLTTFHARQTATERAILALDAQRASPSLDGSRKRPPRRARSARVRDESAVTQHGEGRRRRKAKSAKQSRKSNGALPPRLVCCPMLKRRRRRRRWWWWW